MAVRLAALGWTDEAPVSPRAVILLSSNLMIQPENRGDGFCVANRAVHYHSNRGRQRDHALMDHFVGLGMRRTGAKPGGQINGHGFSYEPGAGIELEDALPILGRVSGFFQQFALRRVQSVLAGIDASGGDFPEKVVGGMTILPLQQDARRRS